MVQESKLDPVLIQEDKKKLLALKFRELPVQTRSSVLRCPGMVMMFLDNL